jgi:dethiobiotin synthetase
VKSKIIFVTGTDTGIGKTVLAAHLTRQLRERRVRVAALKPISSGSRSDARALRRAAANILSLDEANPWHFRAAVAPLLAARRERKHVTLHEVTHYIRRIAIAFDRVVVEGAGGLLSPLGEDFDSRDLIVSLRAETTIVAPNRLGAVNQVRLVLAALPPAFAARAKIVLVQPRRPTAASRTNRKLLAEFVDAARISSMPWLQRKR